MDAGVHAIAVVDVNAICYCCFCIMSFLNITEHQLAFHSFEFCAILNDVHVCEQFSNKYSLYVLVHPNSIFILLDKTHHNPFQNEDRYAH